MTFNELETVFVPARDLQNMSENGFLPQDPGFATRAIHEGQEPSQWNSRAVIPPITLATTFQQDGPAQHRGFEYGRSGNPSRNVLEKCLASLDGAKHGLCFSSGLGATTALVHLLSAGDHLLCGDDVYGGTNRYFSKCASKFGIEIGFVDATDVKGFEKAIKPNTKMVWLESPTNPLLKVCDIKAIAEICKKYPDIILVVDNTFLTSYFQRPLTLGADMVVYSLTKYMNGHADVIMGACSGHSAVFSFYIKGGLEASQTFLKSLKLFYLAESLGGFESLAELPSVMTHASVPADVREKLGITDSLVRLSVGLECAEDLVADIDQALNATAKK
ncbi:hypothetical protein B566_EDAN010574 [Ephemera danica]|nr:hypothetical protein B566_EDAN010574 [Ephemera danica]